MKNIGDLGPNEVIHCKTEEEAEAIVQLMRDNGGSWKQTYFNVYRSKIYYRPYSDTYGSMETHRIIDGDDGAIHPAADFIYKEQKQNNNMNTNQVVIDIPEGYEIDTTNSDLLYGIVKFKPIKKGLPTKWEDLETIDGYYIETDSDIIDIQDTTANGYAVNVWPTRELAEASLALCQLVRLRDVYNDGWKADWTDSRQTKYVIYLVDNKAYESYTHSAQELLSFKDKETRGLFLKNFEDLIEQAKPLL